MTHVPDRELEKILKEVVAQVVEDPNILKYFVEMLKDNSDFIDQAFLHENVSPFLESYGVIPTNPLIESLVSRLHAIGFGANESKSSDDSVKLLDKIIVLKDVTKNQISATERETIDTLWGFQKIRAKKNDQFEGTEALSSKIERKAMKEQRKFLDDLEDKLNEVDNEEKDENEQISTMKMPDLSGNSRERGKGVIAAWTDQLTDTNKLHRYSCP